MGKRKNKSTWRSNSSQSTSQTTDQFNIPRIQIFLLVREIILAYLGGHPEYELNEDNVCLQKEPVECLHIASEAHLTNFFECLQLLAAGSKRVTIMEQDVVTLRALQNFMK